MWYNSDFVNPQPQPEEIPFADKLRQAMIGSTIGGSLGGSIGGRPGAIIGSLAGGALGNPKLRKMMMGGLQSLMGGIGGLFGA